MLPSRVVFGAINIEGIQSTSSTSFALLGFPRILKDCFELVKLL